MADHLPQLVIFHDDHDPRFSGKEIYFNMISSGSKGWSEEEKSAG
jgi:hypothetical protein